MSFLARMRALLGLEKAAISRIEAMTAPAASGPISHPTQPDDTHRKVGEVATQYKGLIHRSAGYEENTEDKNFNGTIEEVIGDYFVFAYFTTIAGTKHKNEDGSSRTAAIRKCAVCEELVLKHEPANLYDSNAIAVLRKDGSQLGYIPSTSAQEIVNGIRLRKELWTALFRKPTRHPDTDRVVGAVILLMLLKGP